MAHHLPLVSISVYLLFCVVSGADSPGWKAGTALELIVMFSFLMGVVFSFFVQLKISLL